MEKKKKKKSGFWHSKKQLKLVLLEKNPVAGGIDYVRYLSMQKVNTFDCVLTEISQVEHGTEMQDSHMAGSAQGNTVYAEEMKMHLCVQCSKT